MKSVILNTVARLTLHLIILFSLFLMFRGHQLPGGGFIAGLTTAAGLLVYLLAFGQTALMEVLPRPTRDFDGMLPLGLAVALLTGLAALVSGREFLSSTYWEFELPPWGHVELTTSFFFDVGVYLVVVGVILSIVLRLGGWKSWN